MSESNDRPSIGRKHAPNRMVKKPSSDGAPRGSDGLRHELPYSTLVRYFFPFFADLDVLVGTRQKLSRRPMKDSLASTHSGGASFFMIVSVPDEAAETICCSIDLPILADRVCHKPASVREGSGVQAEL